MHRFKIFVTALVVLLPCTAVRSQVTVETITAPFNASGGVSIDDSGVVYVADFGQALNFANGTNVYKVIGDSSVVLFASGLQGASGNAFDSEGNLFQSNIAAHRLSKITPAGLVIPWAVAGLTSPVGVAVGAGDTIYVANCGSNSIAKVSPDGASSVWASSGLLNCPNGLTFDTSGNLYTCNFANGNIVKITPSAEFSVLATLPGGRCGHLTYFEGYLYAVARCVHQIYRVSLSGEITLIAGSGGRGNDDGPGSTATFNHPNGIEAIRVGDDIILYVNDAVSLAGDCISVPLNPVVMRKITIGPVDFSAVAHPDSTTVTISQTELQANGIDSTEITITPINSFGQPIIAGVDSITLSHTGGGIVTSPAVDNLDGSFSATVIAPTAPGYDTVTIVVDGVGDPVTLSVHPSLYYWRCGDVNQNGQGPNLTDVTFMVNALFLGGAPLPNPDAANFSGDDRINLTDLTLLVNYLFNNGPAITCSPVG